MSDACDQLGITPQVLPGVAPTTGPARIAGRVVTVRLGRPDRDGGAAPKRHLCAAATDAASDIDVIVVAHQGRSDCAGWGGNLSRAARRRRVAGTIVHGAVRDVDEAIEIGYPVFATTATPLTARGRAEEKAWGATVELAGFTVDHHDYVIADSTGVVFIAAGDIDEVVPTAELIAGKEAAMADDLDAGQPVSDVMGADYESMLEQ